MKIPILYTTHNRLEFTRQTLPALFNNTNNKDALFIIIDTGSNDETIKYLKDNIKIISKNKNYKLIFEKEITLSQAFEKFIDIIVDFDFDYCAKVDNDTLVPKNWLNDLLYAARHNNIDILQAKHYIMNNNVKNWAEWMLTLNKKKFNDNNIYISDFVGGSGVVFNRKTLIKYGNAYHKLKGWTEMQSLHQEWCKAFYDGVFVNLLDMKDDNEPKYYLYPEYYKYSGRLI